MIGSYPHVTIMHDNIMSDGRTKADHGHTGGYNGHGFQQSVMDFTNYCQFINDQWVFLVYIHAGIGYDIQGYYLYSQLDDESCCGLTPYASNIEGYLYITKTVTLKQFDVHQVASFVSPKVAYDNYCNDLRAFAYYGCNHEQYITNIIDAIIMDQNPDSENYYRDLSVSDVDDSHMNVTHNVDKFRTTLPGVQHYTSLVSCPDKRTVTDFNYPEKQICYLNLKDTDFLFIGPDRDQVDINSVDKLIEVADTILATGLPTGRPVKFVTSDRV